VIVVPRAAAGGDQRRGKNEQTQRSVRRRKRG